MTPDDPRHGTYAGAIAHYMNKETLCGPCLGAAATYRRNRRARLYLARTDTLTVDPIGTKRRIRALVALGHSMQAIDRHVGWTRGMTSRVNVSKHEVIHRTTADTIAAAYESLSMTVPEGAYANRNRAIAARRGWLPPLAYDDIDDPNEQPRIVVEPRARLDVDPVVVERMLSGDRIEHTVAERRRVVAELWSRGLGPVGIANLINVADETVGKDIERLGLKRGAA